MKNENFWEKVECEKSFYIPNFEIQEAERKMENREISLYFDLDKKDRKEEYILGIRKREEEDFVLRIDRKGEDMVIKKI